MKRVRRGRRTDDGWSSETRFWSRWLETKGDQWPDDYARRVDPHSPVQDLLLITAIEALPQNTVEILDVGAGPLSTVGMTYGERDLRITAVDPLAPQYDRLLEKAGVTPPVRTIAGTAEQLLEIFEPGSFDIAFSKNALDHASDPALSVANMAAVVRSGGFVALRHFRQEGEARGYGGLHQWNFDELDGDFQVWSRDGMRHNITAPLRSAGHEVTCKRAGEFVNCLIRTAR